MPTPRRFVAPVAIALLAVAITACGTTPSVSGSPVAASTTPAPDPAARDAYNAAICPIFDAILAVDPRVAALREAGAAGNPDAIEVEEVGAVITELGGVLDDLEAVPDWEPGRSLRYQVLTAVHAIRARLLLIADEPTSRESMAALADLPFIASTPMDLALQQAMAGGYRCGEPAAS
jgi:hypothetical protein